MRRIIWISVQILALALLRAEGALAQSAPELLGTWHLDVVGDGGMNAHRPSFGEAQTLRVIEGQGGGLAIHNVASSGLVVPLVAQGSDTWITALGPHYTLTLKDNRLRILGNGRDYGFGRNEFETTPAVFGGKSEVIRFTADWAQRSLFTRLRSNFEAEQGRQFEECFSDRECLNVCESAAGSCEDLTDVVARLLDRLKVRDPLFYHVVDGINIRIVAENRRTILRHEAELARSQTAAKADMRAAALDFFGWLAVDAGTNATEVIMEVPDDESGAKTAAIIEAVGCTLGGYVPVAGNVIAGACGVTAVGRILASGRDTSRDTAQGAGVISLNAVMDQIVATSEEAIEQRHAKYEPILQYVLESERALGDIAELIREGRMAPPTPASRATMLNAMWELVWPNGLYTFAKVSGNLKTMPQAIACAQSFSAKSGAIARSVHTHIIKPDPDSASIEADPTKHVLLDWKLYAGVVGAGKPLSAEALQSFWAYQASEGRGAKSSIWFALQEAKLAFLETNYKVERLILEWAQPDADLYLFFEPVPAIIRYPPKRNAIFGAGPAWIGPSYSGPAGKWAIGPTRCLNFFPQ